MKPYFAAINHWKVEGTEFNVRCMLTSRTILLTETQFSLFINRAKLKPTPKNVTKRRLRRRRTKLRGHGNIKEPNTTKLYLHMKI
jgi:hypothetical protein